MSSTVVCTNCGAVSYENCRCKWLTQTIETTAKPYIMLSSVEYEQLEEANYKQGYRDGYQEGYQKRDAEVAGALT